MHPVDKNRGLTANKVRSLLSYDPETGVFHWLKRAQNVFVGDVAGSCTRQDGYRWITIDNLAYVAHRLAWLHVTGKWPTNQLDHINGVRDDNRIANLREATATQNRRNNRDVKGFQQNAHGRFRARIWVNGKILHLGMFATETEARQAYREAAKKYFGKFAHD
jgi:hypothetical protein